FQARELAIHRCGDMAAADKMEFMFTGETRGDGQRTHDVPMSIAHYAVEDSGHSRYESPRTRRPTMKKYRRLQAQLLAVLVGTFMLGMISAIRPGGEIFPFASWFLFSLVPQQVTSYDLLVRSWGDRNFQPPKPLIEVEGLLRSPHSSTNYQLVQRYGRAVETGDQAGANEAWRLLRARFSTAEPVSIEIWKRSYDPLDRARGGKVEQVRVGAESPRPEIANPRKEGSQ